MVRYSPLFAFQEYIIAGKKNEMLGSGNFVYANKHCFKQILRQIFLIQV